MTVTMPGTHGQAATAADELAAAVAAALRPDNAPFDHDLCRRGVGAAVDKLGAALLGLIEELTPKVSTDVSDTAAERATGLAADILFVRPNH
jgi:hypothetical protein